MNSLVAWGQVAHGQGVRERLPSLTSGVRLTGGFSDALPGWLFAPGKLEQTTHWQREMSRLQDGRGLDALSRSVKAGLLLGHGGRPNREGRRLPSGVVALVGLGRAQAGLLDQRGAVGGD